MPASWQMHSIWCRKLVPCLPEAMAEALAAEVAAEVAEASKRYVWSTILPTQLCKL